MPAWIDFKELRSKLLFEQVLRHYQIEIKLKGRNQHQGICPLPTHNGSRTLASFSANLERGIFQCFGCRARGNLIDFACLMEGVVLGDKEGFRRVAVDLAQALCPSLVRSGKDPTAPEKESPTGSSVTVNAPLDFELKGLDANHPCFATQGFSPETVGYFGLGVAARGSLKGQVAVPLHDHRGSLIGYAGRPIAESSPRYVFPGKRERLGVTHEFRQSLFLYNSFRFNYGLDDLIVVETPESVWWLHQHGYVPTVSTMGETCSPKQAQLMVALATMSGRVWVMTAEERFAHSVLDQVSPHRFVRWIKLEEGMQPTDLPAVHLADRFTL
jgi:DNA primase